MADRHVIALEIVVHHVLPVDGDLALPALAERLHLRDPMGRQLPLVGRNRSATLGPLPAKRTNTKPCQTSNSSGLRPKSALVQAGEARLARHRLQAAVEPVGPAVIEAAHGMAAIAGVALHHRRRPVAADIVEGAQRAVLAAHDEAPLARDVERDVVAGVAQLADMADDLPVREHEIALLQLVELGIPVGPARQGLGRRGGALGGYRLALRKGGHGRSPLMHRRIVAASPREVAACSLPDG